MQSRRGMIRGGKDIKKAQIGAHKEGKAKLVEEMYRVKIKVLTTVIEELKQSILKIVAKIS